ncbi:hypothetical protein [Nonomuraea sp. NPDC048916]|uniref:hypothetical protein n=1 Tax=Nonomuraea sp. NPDC048916 TaxID=3154232 RepID=UPI0033C885C7
MRRWVSLPVRLPASGYRDAADAAGRGLAATWPQRGWGPLPGVAIDHVPVSGPKFRTV